MNIYIVTRRCGTGMEPPACFMTRNEAEEFAREYVMEAALEEYRSYERDGDADPSYEELRIWAEENGLEFFDYYFWDGGYDACEAVVTETEIEVPADSYLRDKLMPHRGHNIACVSYGDWDDPVDICIECEDCGCVLISTENETL